MKRKSKNTLRAMTKFLGLKAKFVNYFPEGTYGKLLPREKRILINANQPRYEHVFTLLHEIGHYLLHFKNPGRQHHPRFFDLQLKIEWLAKLFSKVRRSLRYKFNIKSGKEWEANVWAMCAFVVLAKRFGCRNELIAFC